MKDPKILIAVPCMETIDVRFVQSILSIQKIGDTRLEFLPGNLVYVARDILAAQAVQAEADYVLWLDSDMVFPPDLLRRLWEHRDKGIISGLYFRRGAPFNPVIYKTVNIRNTVDDPESENYDDYPKDTLFPVAAAGFGGLLMKTSILAECFEKYGTCFEPIHSLGEDVSFCYRAKELGYTTYCHSGIQLGHRYMSVSNEDTFLAYKELVRKMNGGKLRG